jgi:hypothetical protein
MSLAGEFERFDLMRGSGAKAGFKKLVLAGKYTFDSRQRECSGSRILRRAVRTEMLRKYSKAISATTTNATIWRFV